MRIRCLGSFIDACPGAKTCRCSHWHNTSCLYFMSYLEKGEIPHDCTVSNCGCVTERTGIRISLLIRMGVLQLLIPYDNCRRVTREVEDVE